MKNPPPPRALSPTYVSVLLASLFINLACSGCSKKEMDKMVNKAKKSASELSDKSGDLLEKAKKGTNDAAASIKQTTSEFTKKTAEISQAAGNLVQLNGSAVIQLDKKTTFPASYANIVPLGNGQSIVQLKSYRDSAAASAFPAFLLQGTTELSSGALDGQSVACRLYVQQQPSSQVWVNKTDELILLKFKIQGKTLTANFPPSPVINQNPQTSLEASGVFECVVLD